MRPSCWKVAISPFATSLAIAPNVRIWAAFVISDPNAKLAALLVRLARLGGWSSVVAAEGVMRGTGRRRSAGADRSLTDTAGLFAQGSCCGRSDRQAAAARLPNRSAGSEAWEHVPRQDRSPASGLRDLQSPAAVRLGSADGLDSGVLLAGNPPRVMRWPRLAWDTAPIEPDRARL